MKTKSETWKEFIKDELEEMDMIKVRGGDGPENPPDPPIIK